jgi:hypothetical protein
VPAGNGSTDMRRVGLDTAFRRQAPTRQRNTLISF